MLTTYNVFEFTRRGYHLLANQKGNNGRELRRFVASVTGPCNLVLQVFNEWDNALTDEQSAVYEAYAEQIREETCVFLPAAVAVSSKTIVDREFNIVQNSFALQGVEVATASVKQLREAVKQIIAMCECMFQFAGNPARELGATAPKCADVVAHAAARTTANRLGSLSAT